MNYLLWISYKGTRYAGFQVQPNAPTVCAVLQDAMQAVFGCRPDVKGCSRTDAGVHARRFALSFCYTGKVPMQKIVPALNAHLPPDIRAVDIRSVPDGFHARYAAHAKTYRYYILNARVDDPFTYDTCHRVGAALDLAAMQAAAAQFIGTHDFFRTLRVRVQRRRPRGYRADDYRLYCCTERRFVYNFRDRRRLPL